MADLIDYYFKGVAHGTDLVNHWLDKPMERAARRVSLDGAQMSLEDDLILREARLNNAKALLDNEGHQSYQQMRFRQALEPYQYTSDRSQLLSNASIANNQGHDAAQQMRFRQALEPLAFQTQGSELQAQNIANQGSAIVGQQANQVMQDAAPQRYATAMNNINAGLINSSTGVATAATDSIYASANQRAASDNMGNIQATLGNQIQAGANLSQAGVFNSQGQLQAAQDVRTKESIIRRAIGTVGYREEDIKKQLHIMAQDTNLSESERIAAATAANELQSGAQGLASKIAQIETAPETLAIQLGLSLAPNTDQYGNYQIYDTFGNLQPISRPELQAMLARMTGVDPSAYQKMGEQVNAKRAGYAYGDSAIFGALGGKATLGIGGAPSEQTAEYAVSENFRRRGWRYDETAGTWLDSSGQVVPPGTVEQHKQQVLTAIGAK